MEHTLGIARGVLELLFALMVLQNFVSAIQGSKNKPKLLKCFWLYRRKKCKMSHSWQLFIIIHGLSPFFNELHVLCSDAFHVVRYKHFIIHISIVIWEIFMCKISKNLVQINFCTALLNIIITNVKLYHQH